MVHGQPAADVDQVVLLGAHPGAIRIGAEFPEDGGNRLVLVAFLALLDKETIFSHARGIEIEADAVSIAESAQVAHVGHADRLAASHVDRTCQRDIGDLVGADALD
jgi:hypothetical protein